ncbi:MAG: MerR family transcriptional regulator [bacterium]
MTTTVNTGKLYFMEKEQVVYNMTELAEKLMVTRQAIYKWIKKGWVKPKRDYKNYPVFTEEDVKKIIKWKSTIK